MTASLAALLFDVDGTLAETEDTHRRAFNRAFAEFGLPWVWDPSLYRRLLAVSGGRERILAFAAAHDPARLATLDAVLPSMHARKTALYTAAVAAGAVSLRPGVEALILAAREAGLRLAVATTTSRANVLALFDGATAGRAHGWFEFLACAEDAPVKKPDPQVYRLALDRLGLPGGACLALEDTTNGVRAAVAAGVPVVVTESVYSVGDDFTGALAVLPDLAMVTVERLRALVPPAG